MTAQADSPARPVKKGRFKRYLILGAAAVVPVAITAYIIVYVVSLVYGLVGMLMDRLLQQVLGLSFSLPRLIVGLISVLVAVAALVLVGLLVATLAGRKLVAEIDKALGRLPILRSIYPSVKQVSDFFFSRDEAAYDQVVAVEYPRQGVYAIGFVTGEGPKGIQDHFGEPAVSVFIPIVPTPISGYLIVARRSELIPLALTVEEAMKFYVSAGMALPPSQLPMKEGDPPPA